MDFSILRRKWITTALLSIALPMSLLATFRLAGVLREPEPPQTITMETTAWNMSRPADNSGYLSIDEKVENSYEDELASIVFGIHFASYTDEEPTLGDHLILSLYVTSNISEGFTNSITINFSQVDPYAFLSISMGSGFIDLQNLEIRTIRSSYTTNNPYIIADSINQQKHTSLRMLAFWMFLDENIYDHRITATLEIMYFNGATHQKITIPILLEVSVD